MPLKKTNKLVSHEHITDLFGLRNSAAVIPLQNLSPCPLFPPSESRMLQASGSLLVFLTILPRINYTCLCWDPLVHPPWDRRQDHPYTSAPVPLPSTNSHPRWVLSTCSDRWNFRRRHMCPGLPFLTWPARPRVSRASSVSDIPQLMLLGNICGLLVILCRTGYICHFAAVKPSLQQDLF